MKIKIKGFIQILIVIFVIVGVTLCANKWRENENGMKSLPCKSPVAVELGSPILGGPTAEFTTNGDNIYAYARRFPHGGLFDSYPGHNLIYIGKSDMPPIYDEQSHLVSNSIKTVADQEGKYTEGIRLPAGRYWLWSGVGDVSIYSCKPDVISDPFPAEVGKPVISAALTCGGNYTPEIDKSLHISSAKKLSTEFTVMGEPSHSYIALRNFGNPDTDIFISVYIGTMDKLPDWNDRQSILSNSTSVFTATKDYYYPMTTLAPSQTYWIWVDKDTDIEFMNCVPKNSSK